MGWFNRLGVDAGANDQGGRFGPGGQAAERPESGRRQPRAGKAIAYPTDSKLLERARQHLVELAAEAGLALRQNYNRKAPRLAVQMGRYAHAKQDKRMRASLNKLKTVVGRVWRHLECRPHQIPATMRDRASDVRPSRFCS